MIGLSDFIAEANLKGFASGEEGIKESDGSTTYIYERGKFKSHDNFFGGEPYAGRQIIHVDGSPYWITVYYGKVTPGQDLEAVYGFLKKVLSLNPKSVRGPQVHKEGTLTYKNIATGNENEFNIEETITDGNKVIYEARFMGGLVDQVKE